MDHRTFDALLLAVFVTFTAVCLLIFGSVG